MFESFKSYHLEIAFKKYLYKTWYIPTNSVPITLLCILLSNGVLDLNNFIHAHIVCVDTDSKYKSNMVQRDLTKVFISHPFYSLVTTVLLLNMRLDVSLWILLIVSLEQV